MNRRTSCSALYAGLSAGARVIPRIIILGIAEVRRLVASCGHEEGDEDGDCGKRKKDSEVSYSAGSVMRMYPRERTSL